MEPLTPRPPRPFQSICSPALVTDLYELAMAQAYLEEDMHDTAVFSLFVRRLPEHRNYLLACGLDDALAFLESLQFDDAAIAYLASLDRRRTRSSNLPPAQPEEKVAEAQPAEARDDTSRRSSAPTRC